MDDGSWQRELAAQARRRGRMLFVVSHRILGDAAEAEDACQCAFARAWEHRDRIREPERLGGWLARTVTNESLQRLRRRQTEQRALTHAVDAARQAGDGAAHDTAPERLALRETLLWALADLPETPRTVVVFRVVKGLSGNEVSELLECSASEVSRQLHRGLEQLRRQLKDELALWAGGIGNGG